MSARPQDQSGYATVPVMQIRANACDQLSLKTLVCLGRCWWDYASDLMPPSIPPTDIIFMLIDSVNMHIACRLHLQNMSLCMIHEPTQARNLAVFA